MFLVILLNIYTFCNILHYKLIFKSLRCLRLKLGSAETFSEVTFRLHEGASVWYGEFIAMMAGMIAIAKPRSPIQPAVLTQTAISDLNDNMQLEGVRVAHTMFSNKEARAISVSGVAFEAVELSSCKLRKASLSDATFTNCLIFGSDFDGSGWLRVETNGGMGSGLVATACTLEDVVFRGTRLNLANFRLSRLKRVMFQDCDLSEADFQATDLSDVVFKNCDLTRAEFSNVSIKRVDMRTSTIDTLKGVTALGGILVTAAQVVGLSLAMASEIGLIVE
jgi:uncharacterized protein YjbI with pentapeptide repeats